MGTIQELKQQLLDAIYLDPQKAFPNFEWQQNNVNVSKFGPYTSAYHVEGGRKSSDNNRRQTYIKDGKTDKHAIIADQNGGSIEIFKLWETEHGEKFPNCPQLFALYGIEPPQRDKEREKREQERKTATEQLLATIRADYLGQAGENIRNYLMAPIESGGRGYDQQTVVAMADYIGVITPATAKQLSAVMGLKLPDNVAQRWPIVVPTITKRGVIQYAKFRTVTPHATGHDKWHNPAEGAAGIGRDDVDPYNYNHVSILSNTGSRTVVVVESEFCAAHATVKGIKNVIALRGSDGIKSTLSRRLVAEKCERVVILYDTETTAEKQKETTDKIQKTVDMVHKATNKLAVYVATIPAHLDAKDPDELLAKYTNGAELLQAIINNAEPAHAWTARQAAERYNVAQTEQERETIENEIIKQAATLERWGQYVNAGKLIKGFCALANVQFTDETLAKAAKAHALEQATAKYEKRYKKAFEELDAARKDKNETAIRGALSDLLEIRRPSDDMEINGGGTVRDAFAELYRDSARDITTNYCMYTRRPDASLRKFHIKLYANGITYFAAGTGHGKSTFLQNIASDVLEKYPDRAVLFYGFEEQKRDTLLEFVNIYAHRHTGNQFGDLSDDGTNDAINKFFGSNDETVFDALQDTNQRRVGDAIRGFFKDFRGADGGQQRLYVYDDNMTSAELVEHALEKAAQIKPAAVFVDYVQFLQSVDEKIKSATQWEDLGNVSKDLIRLNKALGVPVVVAAQVKEKNNDKSFPNQLRYTDIFGASSLGQGAAAIFLLANSTKYAKETKCHYLGGDQLFAGTHQMYIKLDKNRFGPSPAEGLYIYDGAQRWINPETLVDPESAPRKKIAEL